ncbi:hypothetical protein DLAC_06866 [Tieghemostelium lacteum]|uniref:NB-ARC domain-containing protein n=1 Tax=Tieghemostelium lacteum TaxID=361077 RepID=A0A151ZDK3_TIELA|nr:hypothetical protein DLAC_06866 [Tieghemostelium lacteum]|eukprot:KYQ92036.1 hypothetical protein DLAC_06866 [Tieghemostelium lacteum]
MKSLIGRKKESQEIRYLLESSNIVLLEGAPGVGKHSLVSQYQSDYDSQYEVKFEFKDRFSFYLLMVQMSQAMNMPMTTKEFNEAFRAQEARILFVIDDIGPINESFLNSFPTNILNNPRIHLIFIKSIPTELGKLNYSKYTLKAMSPEDSLKLLYNVSPKSTSQEDQQKLITFSQGNPKVLQLVSRFIDKYQVSIDHLNELVDSDDRLGLLTKEIHEHLSKDTKFPMDIFTLLLYFDSFPFVMAWLDKINKKLFNGKPDKIKYLVETLFKLGIAEKEVDSEDAFHISRSLIQEFRKIDSIQWSKNSENFNRFGKCILMLFENIQEMVELIYIQKHLIYMIDNYFDSFPPMDPVTLAELYVICLQTMVKLYQDKEGSAIYCKKAIQALESMDQVEIKLKRLELLKTLSDIYSDDGNHKLAEQTITKAKEILNGIGSQAPPYFHATFDGSLAIAKYQAGQYKESLEILENSFDDLKKSPDQLTVFNALIHYGLSHHKVGGLKNHQNAIVLLEQSTDFVKQLFGQSDPSVPILLNIHIHLAKSYGATSNKQKLNGIILLIKSNQRLDAAVKKDALNDIKQYLKIHNKGILTKKSGNKDKQKSKSKSNTSKSIVSSNTSGYLLVGGVISVALFTAYKLLNK